jgi:conjugal transfer pilus assembly protein TraV
MQNNLPAQRAAMHGDAEAPKDADLSPAKEGQSVMSKPLYSGSPIRTAPKVVRVWFAPWEDTDGDLHDQAYVYLPIDSGRWQIEHNRRRIMDAYRPVRAPVNAQPNQIPPTNKAPLKNAGRAQLPQQQSQGDVEEIGVNQGSKSFGQMATDILKGMVTPSGSGDKQ